VDTELATHLRDEIRQAAQRQAGTIQPLRAEDVADAVAYMVTRDRRIAVSEMLIRADPVRHPEFDGSQMLRGAVSTDVISGLGDVFVMKMYFSEIGDYEMNNHVVEYEPNRRIGWEPEAGRGHPNTAPGSPESARWGQRWTFELTPDGPDATVVTEIYDCSRAPAEERVGMEDGKIWIEAMSWRHGIPDAGRPQSGLACGHDRVHDQAAGSRDLG
jgi:hypothetical protein